LLTQNWFIWNFTPRCFCWSFSLIGIFSVVIMIFLSLCFSLLVYACCQDRLCEDFNLKYEARVTDFYSAWQGAMSMFGFVGVSVECTHTNLQHLSPSQSNLCLANQSESLTVWNNERIQRHLSMQFLLGTLPAESYGRSADQEIHSSLSASGLCFERD
jgi:hypothetical protein